LFKALLRNIKEKGPDAEIGLISKITQALDGNIESLETLNDDERIVLKE